MTQTIKAIETRYKGYRFRSRLEARWAVFFDAAGLKYEYEGQGFETKHGGYLPDFFIPDQERYIEIKPTAEVSGHDLLRMVEFNGPHSLLVVCGHPWPGEYKILYPTDGRLVATNKGWIHCPLCGRLQPLSVDMKWDAGVGVSCWPCDSGRLPLDGWKADESTHFHKGFVCFTPTPAVDKQVRPIAAFKSARSARFEHGESPA